MRTSSQLASVASGDSSKETLVTTTRLSHSLMASVMRKRSSPLTPMDGINVPVALLDEADPRRGDLRRHLIEDESHVLLDGVDDVVHAARSVDHDHDVDEAASLGIEGCLDSIDVPHEDGGRASVNRLVSEEVAAHAPVYSSQTILWMWSSRANFSEAPA